MAEDGGRHDHLRVITALENFQVGAAGERGLDAEADFARRERPRCDFLDAHIFFSVENGGFHAVSLWMRGQSSRNHRPHRWRLYKIRFAQINRLQFFAGDEIRALRGQGRQHRRLRK